EPVDARHPDVEEDDVGRLVLQSGDGFLARPHRGNPISFVFKNASQSRLDRALVVDDQDVLARHWPPQAWTGAATGRPAGSSTTKPLAPRAVSSHPHVPPAPRTH